MATLIELARMHTQLSDAEMARLQRLEASWAVPSDLCFSDLLLFAPVRGSSATRFVILGQIRPTTSQTLYRDDLIGRILDEDERPLMVRAWRLGEIVEGECAVPGSLELARVQCIPVRWQGKLLAVLTRESAPLGGRRPGLLERIYVQTFDRFARMIVSEDFPFPGESTPASDAPRVGDGVVLLDPGGRVEYASPNAVNALHRMGIYSTTEGMTLKELGIEAGAVDQAMSSGLPVTDEVEHAPGVIVQLRCMPLLDQRRFTGALVLLRDVSDLRRRDRLLMSKDATIREVHHRVKNNLQTISSLLRLQARRLDPGPARTALEDAERRVRSIALVHEILSVETGDQVDFHQIVRQLVRMAEEGALSGDRTVHFSVDGDLGELPAPLATPLGVVVAELLQNAAKYAFPESASGGAEARWRIAGPRIDVRMVRYDQELHVDVRDNGVGWPAGFSIEGSDTLGLSIVRNLVTSQLGGTLELFDADGAVARIRLPVPEPTELV